MSAGRFSNLLQTIQLVSNNFLNQVRSYHCLTLTLPNNTMFKSHFQPKLKTKIMIREQMLGSLKSIKRTKWILRSTNSMRLEHRNCNEEHVKVQIKALIRTRRRRQMQALMRRVFERSAQAERQSNETGHWKNLHEAC